jgi:hypothetical protein
MAGRKTQWTDERVALLRQLHAQGLSDGELATALAITPCAAGKRRSKLKLKVNSTVGPMKRYTPNHQNSAAHAINNQPWEPLPGMVKCRCQRCRFWFAAPHPETPYCPDCAIALTPRPDQAAVAAN